MGPRPEGRGKTGPPRRLHQPRAASMGPRPEGRGKHTIHHRGQAHRLGFNGATSRRTWKDGPVGAVNLMFNKASMGPRPEGRGKSNHPKLLIAEALQVVNRVVSGSMFFLGWSISI